MKNEIDKDLKNYHIEIDSLFENSYIVMLLIDPLNGYIRDANPAACDFYGYDRDKIRNIRITDINILSEADVFNEMKNANGFQHNFFQFRHRLSNGEIRDVEVFSGPVEINNEELLFSIIVDITEKVKSQEKIRESEERYRRLVELSPDSIIVFQDLKIVFANNRMAEIMGCSSPSELVGKNVLDIIHPNYVKTSMNRIKRINKGFNAPLIVSKLVNTKGESIDIEITSNALLYNGKQSIQSIIRDISKRKRMEEKLYTYTKQLEKGLEIAKEIQEKHLPTKDIMDGIDIELIYKPLMDLGGDYCKVIVDSNNSMDYELDQGNKNHILEGKTYGVLMGDVVGKGPSAAMLTNEILSFLNYYNLKEQVIHPAKFLKQLNKHLCDISTKNMYLSTASYYRINSVLGKLTYSNAGHEKAIIYKKDENTITWLKTNGILLGISVPELIEFEEKSIDIGVGDKLILYSDGVTELRDTKGKFFGEDRLYELIKDYGDKPANELKSVIENELSKHIQDNKYQDDCIVIIFDFTQIGKTQ